MLLVQWGVFDWGQGRHFQFDLTRQFIEQKEEDDLVTQLSLTFYYEPTAIFETVKPDNRWCHTPSGLNEFEAFINSSAAYVTIAASVPLKVVLKYSAV